MCSGCCKGRQVFFQIRSVSCILATIRRLNHQLKTPANQFVLTTCPCQAPDPYLRDPVIFGRPCSLTAVFLSSRSVFLKVRVKEGNQKDSPPRLLHCIRIFVYIFCARVCKLLRARRWFTANWFVNVVFTLLEKEREKERHSSHFPRVHDTLFVWRSHAICGYASRKIGETFTSHI